MSSNNKEKELLTSTSSTSNDISSQVQENATGNNSILKKLKHELSSDTMKEKMETVKEKMETVKEKMSNLSNQIATGFSTFKAELQLSDDPTSILYKNFGSRGMNRDSSINESKSVDKRSNMNPSGGTNKTEVSEYKLSQYENILQADIVDLEELRKLSWNGVPSKYRSQVWQMLLGYLPTNKSRRQPALLRKRRLYQELITSYYNVSDDERTPTELETLRQILKDIPRTCPDSPFFQQEPIQRCMERILYLWSIRHPASGYVQGMDDLLTPMLYLSLCQYVPDQDVFRVDTSKLDAKVLKDVEADAYWCFNKMLDNIHDHYTFSQPGLQRMILRLDDLIARLDAPLSNYLKQESIQFIQFGFRWMNCLLLRELPFPCVLRLWDTYISEQLGGFENFHVYVCAVLLKTFSAELLPLPYEDLMMFLQDLPTKDWTDDHMEPILSQAFILSTLFDDSPNHLS